MPTKDMPEILLHMVKWEWYYNDSRLGKGQILIFANPVLFSNLSCIIFDGSATIIGVHHVDIVASLLSCRMSL